MNQPLPAISRKIFLVSLFLVLLGILIATVCAISGQRTRRIIDELKMSHDLVVAQSQLTQAILQNADPATIDTLQKNLELQNIRQPVSYTLPGRYFTNWDAYRYEEIVLNGYLYHLPGDSPDIKDSSAIRRPDWPEARLKNVVWYPLYPVLGWLVSKALNVPAYVALTIMSQLCIALAALLFFQFARRYYTMRGELLTPEDTNTAAILAVTTLLFAPCSIFLYANFTESIFVLLLVAFLYCVQSRWWWRAALVAAVASSSRSQGVLFGPILALLFLIDNRWNLKKLPTAFLLGVISALGLFAYMIYLQVTFHDAIAFMHAQKYWNVGINLNTLLNALNPLNALQHIFRYAFQTTPMDWPRLWESLCILWPPIVLLIFRKKLTLDLTIMAWILWALPYVSNGLAGYPPGDSKWMSMGRFMAVMLPIQLILGPLLTRHRWFAIFFLLLSASVFTLFAFKYGAGEWIG